MSLVRSPLLYPFVWPAQRHTFLVEPLTHSLSTNAEVHGKLLAAPAVGVELSCFPHLLLSECGGCGVDAAGAEVPADGDAVDAEVFGELVNTGAGSVLLNKLIDFVRLELAEGLEGLCWRRRACAIRRIRPSLDKIKKLLNSGGRV